MRLRVMMTMNTKKFFLPASFCFALLLAMGSCENRTTTQTPEEQRADSASTAQEAKDDETISNLKKAQQKSERTAEEAELRTQEAKRVEREADEAASESKNAYRAERKAQDKRQEADAQAKKALEAQEKSGKN